MWKVLVADDVFANRELLIEILRDYGNCTSAANGVEAWEAYLTSTGKNTPFDIILLDIVMPGMDGFTFLAKFRECEDQRGVPEAEKIPVIIISAFQHPQLSTLDLQKNDFMLKPVNPVDLLNRINTKVKQKLL